MTTVWHKECHVLLQLLNGYTGVRAENGINHSVLRRHYSGDYRQRGTPERFREGFKITPTYRCKIKSKEDSKGKKATINWENIKRAQDKYEVLRLVQRWLITGKTPVKEDVRGLNQDA